jgi:hypothetical protein
MNRLGLILLVLTVLSCSEEREDPRFPELPLPFSGTVGRHAYELPPPVFVVDALLDGSLIVEGVQVPANPGDQGRVIRKLLLPMAESSRDETVPQRPSMVNLVVRCDRQVPLGNLREVFLAAADPGIRVNRLFFSVYPEEGGVEGTIALFLPLARTTPPGTGVKHDAVVRLKGNREPPGVAAMLANQLNEKQAKSVLLLGEASVLTGRFVEMADAIIRAGVTVIEPDFPPDSMASPPGMTTINGIPVPPIGPVVFPGSITNEINGRSGNYESRDAPPEEVPPPPPGSK